MRRSVPKMLILLLEPIMNLDAWMPAPDWLSIVFLVSVGAVAYTYVGVPALVFLMARLRPRPVHKSAVQPSVSMIVCAFNEEKVIGDKLDNALSLIYPAAQLEIILAAHGSNDRTVEIAQQFESRGVRVLHSPLRQGKIVAMNCAAAVASGEILFFSDANTFNPAGTLEMLVRSFGDPDVGGVSGRKIVLADATRQASAGEAAYWGYETTLKKNESLAGSIGTADGEIFALRASLYQEIPSSVVHDDMYLSLNLVNRGFRVVFDEEAISAEYASRSLEDEFHLKVRYASGGLQIVRHFRAMLLPPRNWFAVQFLSHKLLRWIAPVFLILALLSSGFTTHPLVRMAFWAQASFYSVGLLAWLARDRLRAKVLYFPMYFAVMNTAVLWGLARDFHGGQTPLWRKAAR